MAGWIFADAVSNVPTYTGKAMRLLASALQSKPTTRPLGGYSGVSPGTPSSILSVTTSQYTVQPFSGFLDVSAASDGGTPFSVDTAVQGAVNAADSTNPRIDLLYIRHDDPAESAGPAAPAPVIAYLAGTAAASPTLPATPARSIPLAQINVPKLNNGAPTIALIAPFTVAAGGVLPVSGTAAYPANPYVGMPIYDLTLKVALVWNGTIWVVQAGQDAAWTVLTPASSLNSTGQVFKQGQIVSVEGAASVKTGNWSANTLYPAQLTAPVGYRPDMAIVRAAGTNNPTATARVGINTDGTIDIYTGATAPTVVDLSCLSGYRAQ